MPMLSRNLEKTLRRALALANARQHEYATLEHLLMALLDDEDAIAVLKACAVEVDRLRTSLNDFLDHELTSLAVDGVVDAKPTAGFQRVIQRAAIHVQSSGRSEVTGANVLVGRDLEVERTIQILCRRSKNNPLFVGDPGVGKTAIAEGLALRIIRSEVPDVLNHAVIFALDMGALLAGTRYRGD